MNYKNLGLAGAGISILGTFLPFLKITNPVTGAAIANFQLISGDGMFVLLLMAISGVLIFLNKYLFSVIPTILSFAVVLYALVKCECIRCSCNFFWKRLFSLNVRTHTCISIRTS